MRTKVLTFKIFINASQQTVFDYVSDWEKQSNWIMFTKVKLLSDPDQDTPVTLLATTKVGPIKLVDTMVITSWQSPNRIVVEHTGRIILGKGVFQVHKVSDDSCEFEWQEITPIPFGFLGRLGFKIFRPVIYIPFNMSLKRLRSNVESGVTSK